MKLNFLGRGSAFNPKEGNTSAFFIEDNELFLIDCGENIFERLIRLNLLNTIKAINVIITHTHSDHIGSLGTLAMYSYYILKKPIVIILPEEAKYKSSIDNILKAVGCDIDMYKYVCEKEFDNKYKVFNSIKYIEAKHRKNLNCYSIIFDTNRGIVFYSGDTSELNNVKSLIEENKPIDKLYLDTTTDDFPGNVHLNIDMLKKSIPNDLTKNVYCMHFNNDECIRKAEEYGFNIVKKVRKKK